MHQNDAFRIVLIIALVTVLPVALRYRLKAHATKEKLNRRAEGWFILLTLRPVAAVRMLGVLAFVVNPSWMTWSSVGLPRWLRWGGVALGVGAATLLIHTMRHIGTNLTDTVVTRVRHTLVTSGPYRWVRHPFYVAAAFAVTADSLVTANWFLAVSGAATVALLLLRTRTEERLLIERFGDDYRRYMSQTCRFIP